MSIKFNVKTRIVFNGKEYGSPEELPENVREAYEKAMAGKSAVQLSAGANVKVVFNGKQYKSVDAMPPEERKLYEDAMALVDKENTFPQGEPSPAVEISSPDAAPFTPGSASPANRKLLVLIAAGAAAVILFVLIKVLMAGR